MVSRLNARSGRRRMAAMATSAALGAAIAVYCPFDANAHTYWIDEAMDFGNGCPDAGDLNQVTGYLQTRLDAAGWSGTRWTESNAWPQDFMESGLEWEAGDAARLSVHAGHGWYGILWWGFPHDGACMVDMFSQTRLGTGNGDQSAYGMYLDSCVTNVGQMWRVEPNQVRQQFAYHNSPSIFDNQAGEFFDDTAAVSNRQAWIDRMDDKPGWIFAGWNSPIAITYGQDQADCNNTQNNARLKGGTLLTQAPEPWGYYCYWMHDNGSGGCT